MNRFQIAMPGMQDRGFYSGNLTSTRRQERIMKYNTRLFWPLQGLRYIVAYAAAIGISPYAACGQTANSSQSEARHATVSPVETEKAACARIVELGGNCETDADGHIVGVNLVFKTDAFGKKVRNDLDCTGALAVLHSFPKLASLSFPLTSLSDAGLQEIGKLHQLESLRIADKAYFAAPGPANITDAGVKHLADLSRLQVLQLQNCKLTDASMPTIGSFASLTELSMRGNDITDAGIKELSGPKLGVVRMATTKIGAAGLAHLANLPIESLGLSHCPLIDDEAMEELRRFSKLKSVWLSATQVTDHGLSRITTLPLEFLAIGSCPVTDACSFSIEQIESLRELHFHYTRTTDQFLLVVGRLKNLEHIVVSTGCTLQGVAQLRALKPDLTVVGDWRHETWTNMVKLGKAFGDFEEKHGVLPTTEYRDEFGKPLLSWRVALLPMLGEQELFNELRLDEPWDSEHNIKLLSRIPAVYKNPNSRLEVEVGHTLLVATVGETCLLQADRPASTADASDGASETALVLTTVADVAVPWTAPWDYQVDLEHPTQNVPNDMHLTFVLLADGRVRSIPKDTDQGVFRAMYTRAGND